MDKKEKIQSLLKRLDEIQNDSGGSIDSDLSNLTDEAIDEEMAGLSNEVKNNVTIKYLDSLNGKLDSFKKDFDLTPLASTIESFKEELDKIQNQIKTDTNVTTEQFETKLKDLKSDLAKITSNDDSKEVAKKLLSLEKEITDQKKKDKEINDILASLDTRISEIPTQIANTKNENVQVIENVKVILNSDTDKKVEQLRTDVFTRFNEGSGNMNRQILASASILSKKYTDINFIGASATDDNTNKRVNVTLGGAGTPSAPVNSIQYNNAGVFGGSSNLLFDGNLTTYTNLSLGVTQDASKGILLTNTTAATNILSQISPGFVWEGQGWKLNATAASQSVRFRADVLPIQGSANPGGRWRILSSVNGGTYFDAFGIGLLGEIWLNQAGTPFVGNVGNAIISQGPGTAAVWGTPAVVFTAGSLTTFSSVGGNHINIGGTATQDANLNMAGLYSFNVQTATSINMLSNGSQDFFTQNYPDGILHLGGNGYCWIGDVASDVNGNFFSVDDGNQEIMARAITYDFNLNSAGTPYFNVYGGSLGDSVFYARGDGYVFIGDGNGAGNSNYILVDNPSIRITYNSPEHLFNINAENSNTWHIYSPFAGQNVVQVDQNYYELLFNEQNWGKVAVGYGGGFLSDPTTSAFSVKGSEAHNVTSIAAGASPYSVQYLERSLMVAATGGTFSLILPDAAAFPNREIWVRNTSTTDNVDVTSAGGNIDGGSTVTIKSNSAAIFQSDNTNWWVMAYKT